MKKLCQKLKLLMNIKELQFLFGCIGIQISYVSLAYFEEKMY